MRSTDLAAAAAHELGTPLSTIALVAKELEYELGKDSPYREDLQLLHSQARRCREILQKLTRKPDEQDPMHASLTVVELLEEASAPHRAAGKRIIISADPLPGLDDEVRIEPVAHRRPGVIYGLGNLIENAVGFAASEVQLSARWNGSHVYFTITDDGPGFAPEMMDSIGEPYITSRRYEDKGDQGHSGLGLGPVHSKDACWNGPGPRFRSRTLLRPAGGPTFRSPGREPPSSCRRGLSIGRDGVVCP